MNSICLIGRLTADPDFKIVNDKGLSKFTVAVNDRFNKDNADFIDCVAWGKIAELIADHFHKGKEIGLTGRLKQERWETGEGKKRNKITVICETFDFIGKKDD